MKKRVRDVCWLCEDPDALVTGEPGDVILDCGWRIHRRCLRVLANLLLAGSILIDNKQTTTARGVR
jgi:hypothetical protein